MRPTTANVHTGEICNTPATKALKWNAKIHNLLRVDSTTAQWPSALQWVLWGIYVVKAVETVEIIFQKFWKYDACSIKKVVCRFDPIPKGSRNETVSAVLAM